MDADQLVLGDVADLAASLQPPHAIGIVRDIEGTFAGKPVAPRNETSVMVLDCARLKDWDPETHVRSGSAQQRRTRVQVRSATRTSFAWPGWTRL